MRPAHTLRPLLAVLALAALLHACTRQAPREPIEVRHYRVDWAALEAPVLRWDDFAAQGVVLTPAQWPLQVSLNRLLAGDFTGMIDGLDLSFRSSRIPTDVLRDLYEEGYLAAYVRVEHTGDARATFDPRWLVVVADEATLLPPVPPEALPATMEEIDWMRTGAVVAAVALLAALAVAGRENRGGRGVYIQGQLNLRGLPYTAEPRRGRDAAPPTRPPRDTGLLTQEVLQPGDVREGFLLFSLDQDVADWETARLALNR